MSFSFDLGIIAVSKCDKCDRHTLHVIDEPNNEKCFFCDPTYHQTETSNDPSTMSPPSE